MQMSGKNQSGSEQKGENFFLRHEKDVGGDNKDQHKERKCSKRG